MGYTYCSLSEGDALIRVGAFDWKNHIMLIYDDDGHRIVLSPKQGERLLKILPKAIDICKEADSEKCIRRSVRQYDANQI